MSSQNLTTNRYTPHINSHRPLFQQLSTGIIGFVVFFPYPSGHLCCLQTQAVKACRKHATRKICPETASKHKNIRFILLHRSPCLIKKMQCFVFLEKLHNNNPVLIWVNEQQCIYLTNYFQKDLSVTLPQLLFEQLMSLSISSFQIWVISETQLLFMLCFKLYVILKQDTYDNSIRNLQFLDEI